MSPRYLIPLAALLIAVMIWVGLRNADDSRTPFAAPEPAPASSTQPAIELDRPDTVSIEPNAPAEAPANSTAAQVHALTRADASETIVLYGTVIRPPNTDTTDEETYVGATDRLGARAGAKVSADGAYSISGLAPGHCWIQAESSPPACAASRAHAELDLALTDSPKRFDIVLEVTPAVLVKVVDRDGTPVLTPGLLAVATTADLGDWFDEMKDRCLNVGGLGSFRDGRFTGGPFPDGFIGRILLEKSPPVLVSLLYRNRVLETRRVERGQTQIVFTVDASALEPSTVRVRIVDEHGVAPTHAMVELNGDPAHTMVREGDGWIATFVMPGKYELRPFAWGLETRTLPVLVPPGTETDLGTLVLAPEQSVSGMVHIAHDENLSDIWLRCDECDAEGETHVSGTRHMNRLNSDGTFSIKNLTRGLYLLRVDQREPKFGEWARIIDTHNGPVTNVDIALVRGVPLALRPSKSDGSMVRFRILDGERTPIVSGRLRQNSPRPILLAPGKYDIEVVEPEPARKHVTIGSTPVELALP